MKGIRDRIEFLKGDITAENVDAIVNAANTDLLLGAGVAGAIRTKGGASIQNECDAHGPVELGGAVLTGGGHLPARYVIHAAGMRLGGYPTEDSIRLATLNSLKIASENKFTTVSFPAIGTGIGGFSMSQAARIMLTVAHGFIAEHDFPRKIRFTLYDTEAFQEFKEAWGKMQNY